MSWPLWPKADEKALAGYAVAGTGRLVRLACGDCGCTRGRRPGPDPPGAVRRQPRWTSAGPCEMYRADEARRRCGRPRSSSEGRRMPPASTWRCCSRARRSARNCSPPLSCSTDTHWWRCPRGRTGGVLTASSAPRARRRLALRRGCSTDSEALPNWSPGRVRPGRVHRVRDGPGGSIRPPLRAGAERDGLMVRPRDRGRTGATGLPGREFQFAIDVAYLQDMVGIEVYDPSRTAWSGSTWTCGCAIANSWTSTRSWPGGRNNQHPRPVHRRAAVGYCLVTGDAGTGKTALLAEWLRRLTDRATQPGLSLHQQAVRHGGPAVRLLPVAAAAGLLGVGPAGERDRVARHPGGELAGSAGRRPPAAGAGRHGDRRRGRDRGMVPVQGDPAARTSRRGAYRALRSVRRGTDWRRELGLRNPQVLRLGTFDDTADGHSRRRRAPAWLLEPEAFAALTQPPRAIRSTSDCSATWSSITRSRTSTTSPGSSRACGTTSGRGGPI